MMRAYCSGRASLRNAEPRRAYSEYSALISLDFIFCLRGKRALPPAARLLRKQQFAM
jgi:hypothetical protein